MLSRLRHRYQRFASRLRALPRWLVDRLLLLLLHRAPWLLRLSGALTRRLLPPRPQPWLLLDISTIRQKDDRTGIQRVVRALTLEWLRHPPSGCRVMPVYASPTGGYRHTRLISPGQPLCLAHDHAWPQEGAPMRPHPGDRFLGLDLTLHLFPVQEARLLHWRGRGVAIHYVVYDLIPLLHPHFFEALLSHRFAQWMAALARQADGLHCISATVAEELAAWLDHHPAPGHRRPRIDHFPLGADIENSAPSRGLPAGHAELLQRMEQGTSYLMVGTIEPRKGHDQVLDAMEQCWAQGDSTLLVIVGKPGWKTDALQQRLRRHPQAGRRLFWLQGVSDEYLERLYQAASGLIAASWAEGYGLPLVEAQRRGVPVLARDIPVFREVGGEQASYFRADSAQDLASQLQCWQPSTTMTSAQQQTTWQQSAQALGKRLA